MRSGAEDAVMGTMFEFGPTDGAIERRLYVSGDTLLIEDLKEIRSAGRRAAEQRALVATEALNRLSAKEEERGTVALSRGQVMVLDRARLAERAGVDPRKRPEELTVVEMARLARAVL